MAFVVLTDLPCSAALAVTAVGRGAFLEQHIDAFCHAAEASPMQRGLLARARAIKLTTGLPACESRSEFESRAQEQGSRAESGLAEVPHQPRVPRFARPMQCGVALGVNSIHLCAVLNQKPCHWNAAGLGRPHDRGAMEFVLGAGDKVYLTRRGM